MRKEQVENSLSKKIAALTNHNDALVLVTFAAALGQTISCYEGKKEVQFLIPKEGGISRIQFYLEKNLSFKKLLLAVREQMVKEKNEENPGIEEVTPCQKIVLYHKGIHTAFQGQKDYLNIGIEEVDGNYMLQFSGEEGSTYWKDVLDSFIDTFNVIIAQGVSDPGISMDDVCFLGEENKKKILCFGKGEEKETSSNMLEKIHGVVEQYPEKTAVFAAGNALSYQELWEYSSKLADILESKGAKKGDHIALFTSRKVETIVGILGIIMAGAAYVPIETDYGVERMEYMVKDSGSIFAISASDISVITSIPTFQISLQELGQHVMAKEGNYEEAAEQNRYVIYTSGSTGKPKGVAVQNEQLMNLCNWYANVTNMTSDSKVLMLNVFGFDASVKNIFSSMLCGSELVLGPEYLFDFEGILELIRTCKITIMNCVPSLFYELLDVDKENGFTALKQLELIVLGGEAIERKRIEDWFQSDLFQTKIMNVYGPTECTSVSTYGFLDKEKLMSGEPINIGRPCYNKQVYVLSEDGKICPIHSVGELCISGIGTVDSYIGQAKTSREVFKKDLLHKERTLYHTGDLVYWNADGELIFIGRKDRQVKIDGHRIELGEIEQALLSQYEVMEQCCVLLEEQNNHKTLVAHVVMDAGAEPIQKIEDKMSDWLPAFMIPKKIITHQAFPLTPHGKIDYKALGKSLDEKKAMKETSTEKLSVRERIANIWKKILSVDEVDYNTNFFDAGGYSLLLYKLSRMIEIELKCKITYVELMTYTTIDTFSEYIEKKMSREALDPKELAKQKLKELKKNRSKNW
ncbi:non-ribosomal peptide synthetase [[Clostridium] polysaccharolyticum]|uniref:Amino acid adenylation domain-containing protein n=1 Tax=[Clostridium] polysaccharolyticum TaxID=29364 RepID=A0A1I0AE52_9FIRM|nr:non-ribosomal peptide synthetase [[Clostridium] polysaccharolyticum]SES92544.1 amino acid adenylation domain-containing protein [[Clostridium] polysaccharolyticum]